MSYCRSVFKHHNASAECFSCTFILYLSVCILKLQILWYTLNYLSCIFLFFNILLDEKDIIKGKRRERIPAQRGEVSNFARVLSRLAGSWAMFVSLKWLHSRCCPGLLGTEQHKRWKIRLWKLFSLVYLYTPRPQSKQLSLTWLG